MKKYRFLGVLLLIFLFACEEEKDLPLPMVEDASVVVLNEGNFGRATGTIDLYQPTSQNVQNEVFRGANSGRPLGDVVQSMTVIGELGYIVVNNSQKIEIVKLSDFSAVGSISGLNSPRYLLPLGNNKAYVSDLYADEIHIIDLSSRQKMGSISTGGWIENMQFVNSKVYATQMEEDSLWVINPQNDQLIRKLGTAEQPQYLQVDANGKLWVLCSGSFQQGMGALMRFNPNNDSLELRLDFLNADDFPTELDINASGDRLYYLNEHLFELSIDAQALPTSPLVDGSNKLYYGLGIHPDDGSIYLADAIDYQQKGTIEIYQANGTLLNTFKSGIIPADFVYLP